MSYQQTISELRSEIFSLVAEAAKKGLTNQVANLARLAKTCDAALGTATGLDAELGRIKQELKNTNLTKTDLASHVPYPPGNTLLKHSRKTGGRERGRRAREQWVSKAMADHRVHLHRLGEVTYQTRSGDVVGIAYASEDPKRPYPWWLGLPETQPCFVVLLCETESGDVVDFVFPPAFVSQIWASLSRDTNHHVKFHVLRSGSNWKLKLKDGPLVEIAQYRGKLGILQ